MRRHLGSSPTSASSAHDRKRQIGCGIKGNETRRVSERIWKPSKRQDGLKGLQAGDRW